MFEARIGVVRQTLREHDDAWFLLIHGHGEDGEMLTTLDRASRERVLFSAYEGARDEEMAPDP